MRINAKTVKNTLLLPFKQDPKAFKEKRTLFWDRVRVAKKGQMQYQPFPSVLLWGVWIPGVRSQPALHHQGRWM